MTDLADANIETNYSHLIGLAESYLRGRGGIAPEEALVTHVFGTSTSTAMWKPLLRSCLGTSDRVTLRPDGCWVLNGFHVDRPATEQGSLLGEFVVVDVETTGLKPATQRIIEVAAIRYRDGREIARCDSLVNPHRRLPGYIVSLTGIRDLDLVEAPEFSSIVGQLLEVLEGAVVIGHNVRFDVSFLNAELKRAGHPQLANELLDTMGLAVRLMPHVRKPSLERVADALGVPNRAGRAHRAGMDAEITAEVAIRLAKHAEESGYTTFDQLRGLGGAAPRRPSERHARASTVADRSLLTDIPKLPGVYLMRNAQGQVIYVGKAKNLRDRVGSYFSQQLGYTRKMDGLIESLSSIDTEVVGSELEALLLESQLIRRYQPRYNTAMRSHEWYPFIRIDIANPWPRLSLSRARRDDGAVYFGPFRSGSSARKTVDLINRVVPLRTCTRSFRDARSYGSPCIELDLGRCSGPCVGRTDHESYHALVTDVISFLDGRDETLYEHIWRGLEDAAATLDFERAERLRRELRVAETVVKSQRRIRSAIEHGCCVAVLPSSADGAREVLLVTRGKLWAQFRVADDDDPEKLATRLERSWLRYLSCDPGELDHDTVDEAHLLMRWLVRLEGTGSHQQVDEDTDWRSLASAILTIPPDQIFTAYSDLPAVDESPEEEESGWSEGRTLSEDAFERSTGEPATEQPRIATRSRASRRSIKDSR